MKRFIILLILLFLSPVYTLAAEGDPASHVTITVVMPGDETIDYGQLTMDNSEDDEPSADNPSVIPKLYPTDVSETEEDGIRRIVKTYELGEGDDPADIPRESFERDGWRYSLTDITKKETATADSREHTEIVTVNTDTKEMEAILPLLSPTKEIKTGDGYFGVLTLDVSGITVETAGTKKSSYTASIKREYPHLSANDTSLVPKTVTEGSRTYILASVDWTAQTAETVDYDSIPASYTAVATYTAPASKTVVTGYVTTAKYKGTVSKLNQGATVYTAYFTGSEIVPERIPLEFIEQAAPTPADNEQPAVLEEPPAVPAERQGNMLNMLIPAALVLLMLGALGGYYVLGVFMKKNAKKGVSGK
ncbi:MAG: hypothetical protein LBR76_03430 [Oscillospiraceae bacterium]|nr:hypothetical protein [Oscillospiraceae bacterium]